MATLPQEVPLPIPESDEPLLTFVTGKSLAGASIAFIAKSSKTASDASGVTIAGVVTDEAAGIFTVQLEDTVTALAVGFGWYRIVVTIASHPVTYRYGPLVVGDV
jgi:hypothetical protein